MKLKYTVWALALVALVASCNKEAEPVQAGGATVGTEQVANPADNTPFALSFDADVDMEQEDVAMDGEVDELKSFKYKVGANGTERDLLPEGKPLHSLCMISDVTGSFLYYVELEWTKVKGENKFFVKQLDVKQQGTQTSIPRLDVSGGRKWFIKGFLTYNKANIKSKRVDYAPNGTGDLKLVAQSTGGASKEMDIPFYFDWTPLFVDQLDSNSKGIEAINTSKTVQSNKTARGILFKPFGSMARLTLSNEEPMDMKVKSLTLVSNVLTPSHGYVDLARPTVPADAKQALNYKTLNVRPSLSLGLSDLPITIGAGATHDKSYIMWLMPQTPAAGAKPSTQIMANVVRTVSGVEQAFPKMTSLYVWGSTKKKAPSDRKRYHIQAKLHRPKMPLEYFSKGYKQGRDKNATFGPASGTKFKYGEIGNFEPAGYHVISYDDAYLLGWHGLRYSQISDKGFRGAHNSTIDGQNYYANSVWQYVTAERVVYALRYIDVHGGKQFSAWRYDRSDATRTKVECVYLGPNYKGDFEDIKKAEFWTLHQNDIISRSFDRATTQLHSPDEYLTAHNYNARLMSWLKGRAPLNNGQWKDGNFVWTLSPSNNLDFFITPNYSDTGSYIGPVYQAGRPVNMSVPLIMMQDWSNKEFNG